MADPHEYDDAFYETESSSGGLVRLSHLNNKSSVLCPENQDITSQYLVLQQLDAHQRMISRAKSTVDASAPKSLQSYISMADRQKKKQWQNLNGSKEQGMDILNGTYKQQMPSRLHTPFSEEEDIASLNASSVNKGVQTGITFETVNSKTEDKISWYLEALHHGELHSQPFVSTENTRNASQQSNISATRQQKRIVKGDIMNWHEKSFVKSKKPFSPRILNSTAKAKLKDMRCYNPPFRKKKSNSSHSSDTFESYDNDEESEEDVQKSSTASSVEEETQVNAPQSRESYSNFKHTFLRPLRPQHREYFETYNSDILSRSEEDKYLSFLSKVTGDILRSGVYSDKAIQQAFEFHMQFYKEESNKEKLQSLLNQVLEGLKISGDELDDLSSYRNPLLLNFSRPTTPPEKESMDVLSTNNPSRFEPEPNVLSVENQAINTHLTNGILTGALQNDQSILQENTNSLEEES